MFSLNPNLNLILAYVLNSTRLGSRTSSSSGSQLLVVTSLYFVDSVGKFVLSLDSFVLCKFCCNLQCIGIFPLFALFSPICAFDIISIKT